MEKFAKTETKLNWKKAVENETETEKYFTTEITLHDLKRLLYQVTRNVSVSVLVSSLVFLPSAGSVSPAKSVPCAVNCAPM